MSRHRVILLVAIACAILAAAVRHLWNGVVVPNGDTTAIILNWSRLANVARIVSLLCQPQLQGTISRIFIWNNSPHKLNYTTFVESGCPESKLTLYNSPSNLYFQARFFACEQSHTPYCFIQDDDYLIWPEILLAMRSRINESSRSAIHLLPPHEMLSSQLRSVSAGTHIHTSFAWLGHGTIMPRSMASDFISLLRRLNASEETMKMADNYFTVLMNTIPETWFDQGVDLGGGQPFTVGMEGNERNDRHIRSATQILDTLVSKKGLDHSQIPFIDTTEYKVPTTISRAPCLGRVCIFETSIQLLPPMFRAEVSMAEEMLSKAHEKFESLSAEYKQQYINHPPSHAVDGKNDTCFQSPTNASEGDWISLDLVSRPSTGIATINLIIDEGTETILSSTVVEVDIEGWVSLEQKISCESHSQSTLRLCRIMIEGQRVRLLLKRSMDKRWTVCEMWASVVA